MKPGRNNAITDIAGLRVGHATAAGDGAQTGTTVLLGPEGGFTAAVDVRGGGPGTRETDALDPRNLVPRVEAITLTGGSAYGLRAADGVMDWLADRGRGYPVGPGIVVPVVPAAVVFDLGRGGDWTKRPDASFGLTAIQNAFDSGDFADVAMGCVGAGTGAKLGDLKGAVGTASTVLPSGHIVAALVVANAAGSAVDPVTGLPYGAHLGLGDEFGLTPPSHDEHTAALASFGPPATPPLNTTIGIIATDAALDRSQTLKLAGVAHDGLARSVRPVHTLFDGDSIFGVSTGEKPLPQVDPATPYAVLEQAMAVTMLHAAAADVFSRAMVHAVLNARSVAGLAPSYRDLYPVASAGYKR